MGLNVLYFNVLLSACRIIIFTFVPLSETVTAKVLYQLPLTTVPLVRNFEMNKLKQCIMLQCIIKNL